MNFKLTVIVAAVFVGMSAACICYVLHLAILIIIEKMRNSLVVDAHRTLFAPMVYVGQAWKSSGLTQKRQAELPVRDMLTGAISERYIKHIAILCTDKKH
jgi:hypothetical protein